MSKDDLVRPLGLFIQPACLHHKYIRHANSSHIFERPERLRAVLLGVAAAVARLEESGEEVPRPSLPAEDDPGSSGGAIDDEQKRPADGTPTAGSGDLSSLLSSLSISSISGPPYTPPDAHLNIVTPPIPPTQPGQILLHHPALQLAHAPPSPAPFPTSFTTSSPYMKDLYRWARGAVERIECGGREDQESGSEIPPGLGLNESDLYLGPGSILAIEGAVSPLAGAKEMSS